ncbi:MAG: hypothetical protein WKG01_32155 [Kofleriaceae bacterium]
MTDALKVHLRVFEIHRTTLRVVTLRPQTGVRFSTNYYHDTWHILAGPDGAALLGRLLWGLAFQNQPGTCVLIDQAHLVPTPFEGDPPDPILLVPAGLTRIDLDVLRALKLRLRRSPGNPTTIRWHTFGMAAAQAADVDHRRRWRPDELLGARERMSRRAGFICFTAPAELLRQNALAMACMVRPGYLPLATRDAPGTYHYDGELQLVDEFYNSAVAARIARHEILGEDRPIADDAERERIFDRKEQVERKARARSE